MRAVDLLEALKVITKTQPQATVNAQHDRLWVGDYKPEAMTHEDAERLVSLGWFKAEDAWSHFT